MADRAELRERMTVEACLALEGEPDVRYELVGGALRAVTPRPDRHGVVTLACASCGSWIATAGGCSTGAARPNRSFGSRTSSAAAASRARSSTPPSLDGPNAGLDERI